MKPLIKEKVKLFVIYNIFLLVLLFAYPPSRNYINTKLTNQINKLTYTKIIDKNVDYKNVDYKKLPMKNHFIVAGHAYGHHGGTNVGMNKKLFKCLKESISDSTNFIVFTGDFVRTPDKKSFSTFRKQMDTLNTPYYLA